MSENTSDPDRIERDLDQTRSRFGSHLTELQDRLSPGQVIDDLMKYFRGSEGADFGRNLLESVRANPLPAAVTGIGLAWLMAANPRRDSSATETAAQASKTMNVYRGPTSSVDNDAGTLSRLHAAGQGVVRQTGEAEQAYTARVNEARGQALGLTRRAQESAESFAERIQDALGTAKQTLVGSAHDMRDQVGAAAASLSNVAQQAAQSVGGVAQSATDALARGGRAAGDKSGNLVSALVESPVLLGALGLAAGALLGVLLPQSEQEEKALGDIAGQARDTARGLAQDAVDRGGNVAQAVVDASSTSAQSRGLTDGKSPGALVDAAPSGELAGSVKEVARDVLRAGDEAIRTEGTGKKDSEGPRPA